MLATEFFFSQTFYSRAPCKHTKSQQKSTHAEYEKIIFPCRRHVFMQISCITSMFYSKKFIFSLTRLTIKVDFLEREDRTTYAELLQDNR